MGARGPGARGVQRPAQPARLLPPVAQTATLIDDDRPQASPCPSLLHQALHQAANLVSPTTPADTLQPCCMLLPKHQTSLHSISPISITYSWRPGATKRWPMLRPAMVAYQSKHAVLPGERAPGSVVAQNSSQI
jgi:hypothetical protein